jgi:hypothetical protein
MDFTIQTPTGDNRPAIGICQYRDGECPGRYAAVATSFDMFVRLLIGQDITVYRKVGISDLQSYAFTELFQPSLLLHYEEHVRNFRFFLGIAALISIF